MSGYTRSPRLTKGALVLVDPETGAVKRTVVLQYNPDTLSRSLQIQGSGATGDRSEALRLKGPPVETIKLEAELDATDDLERPNQHPGTVEHGLHARLAALETLAFPTSAALVFNDALAASGTIEITPAESPLTLFIFGARRILPVRVAELSVVEEAFDADLNPIRAKVNLGLRVLTVDDLGFRHRGGGLFMSALLAKEKLLAGGAGAGARAFSIGAR